MGPGVMFRNLLRVRRCCEETQGALTADRDRLQHCWQVAQIMRAVLRTLAQCHAHRVLHRDVKPGNFMLLTTGQKSPVKAIGEWGKAV